MADKQDSPDAVVDGQANEQAADTAADKVAEMVADVAAKAAQMATEDASSDQVAADGDSTASGAEGDATFSDAGGEEAGSKKAEGEKSVEDQIDSLEKQLAAAKEQSLRDKAEMQNIRRRSERDVEQAHKFGLEKLINGLLPVLDNLDRALGAVEAEKRAENEAVNSVLEGVELTRKTAVDVLKSFSVEVLEPVGEPFDPQLHEAMTMIESATAEPNTVVDVLQKGYTLHGRLIRAAMVVVAK